MPSVYRSLSGIPHRRSSGASLKRSIHWLRLGEFPGAVQNFGAGAIEPRRPIPSIHNRQAIRNLAVAAAELDRHRAVRVLCCGDVIEIIGVILILLEIALRVIDADGPESVDRHSCGNGQPIDRLAVIPGGRVADIKRDRLRVAAPTRRSAYDMPYRVDLTLLAERPPHIFDSRCEHQKRIADLVETGLVPIR